MADDKNTKKTTQDSDDSNNKWKSVTKKPTVTSYDINKKNI